MLNALVEIVDNLRQPLNYWCMGLHGDKLRGQGRVTLYFIRANIYAPLFQSCAIVNA